MARGSFELVPINPYSTSITIRILAFSVDSAKAMPLQVIALLTKGYCSHWLGPPEDGPWESPSGERRVRLCKVSVSYRIDFAERGSRITDAGSLAKGVSTAA